jgi:Ty3 transposon capsid-like protein
MADPNAPAAITNADLIALHEVIHDLQTRVNEVSAPRASGPKCQKPKSFDGKNTAQLPEFLFQVRIAFEARPSDFPTDKAKILYASSFLEGAALAYVEPYYGKADNPPWMRDFSLFADELTKVFGDPDKLGNETYKLRKLRQTGSAAAYAAEFQRLASRLSWNDAALVSQFFDGLKDSVQDELVKTDYPTKLEGLIPIAVRIDNLQHHRASRRGQQHKNQPQAHRRNQFMHVASRPQAVAPSQPAFTSQTSAQSAAAHSGPRPMELDATRPTHPRLTEQQKEHRRKNGLCLYCGDPGHVVRQCSVRPKPHPRPARIAEVSASSGNDPAQL